MSEISRYSPSTVLGSEMWQVKAAAIEGIVPAANATAPVPTFNKKARHERRASPQYDFR